MHNAQDHPLVATIPGNFQVGVVESFGKMNKMRERKEGGANGKEKAGRE
jgi:hypothetical protein